MRTWFERRFAAPTPVQIDCWKAVDTGDHVLVCAPTGSGKTLAAFLAFLDTLIRTPQKQLPPGPPVIYVSPLRALSNDIAKNLEQPLAEMRTIAHEQGETLPDIRVLVRTGDTSPTQRQRMLRRPPHILVTTPESLYLMVTARRSRDFLRHARAVIVDEIHALVQDRRGAHLALTLERLDQLAGRDLQRIGLSATQRPLEVVAAYLVGAKNVRRGKPSCRLIDHGRRRDLDLRVVVPSRPLSAICSREVWEAVLQRLVEDIRAHRSTIVFVPTRRLAERLAHQLRERLGEDTVASHHGSLAAHIRHDAERRLKEGKLRAIVATASLELGIDVGYIDLVCNVGSPRSIVSFLQRVGRAGHGIGRVSKGHLYPLTWDDLLEAFALMHAVRDNRLEAVEIPQAPLDILAQQIVAACAAEEQCEEDELFALVRRAYPYRDLPREKFDAVVTMLTTRAHGMRRPLLTRDPMQRALRARKGARSFALMNGGAIPELADYPVYTLEEHRFVGTVNEDFALESCIGDVFLLGNRTWEVQWVRRGEMIVRDAGDRPATVPFWLGEAPARSHELSLALGETRKHLARVYESLDTASQEIVATQLEQGLETPDTLQTLPPPFLQTLRELAREYAADEWAAYQALRYVAVQKRATGTVPTPHRIVFERFFDDTGGMQIVIHSPWGARVNRAWGLALRKRFCRRFDFELQAAADDNGILLSVGPQHSFPLDMLFELVTPETLLPALEQAVLASPVFLVRWRWNANRSLLVARMERGRKVPPALQRFRADDLLAEVFPQQVACFEHRPPDLPIPDHPLVQQTIHDCLHEAMDLDGAWRVLDGYRRGLIEFVACETREPSPFSYALLNGRPYTFLDGAPLEERRSRAVITGRLPDVSAGDLMQLSPEAIDTVRTQVGDSVRTAEDLLDLLSSCVLIPSELMRGEWLPLAEELMSQGLAAEISSPAFRGFAATEGLPTVAAVYNLNSCTVRPPHLRSAASRAMDGGVAIRELVAGLLELLAVATAERLAELTRLPVETVRAALGALEAEGRVVQGRFDPRDDSGNVQWANRRLLWRITRLTIRQLRARAAPVPRDNLIAFLLESHGITGPLRPRGPEGLLAVIERLQGWQAPAGSWEPHLLAARSAEYRSDWLDQLHLHAAITWGRLDRNDETSGTLHRGTPLTFCCRDDLEWLMPPAPPDSARERLSSAAREVYECLARRGALFERDLIREADLLPAQVREALLELAAAGLVTCDSFAAVRPRIAPAYELRRQRRRRSQRDESATGSMPGRWSLLAVDQPRVDPRERAHRWAKLLLHRYGVVGREVHRQEPLAPPWREIHRALRGLELRGEVRGGQFVEGISGEQFAFPDVVERLRETELVPELLVLSRCDPLCSPVLLGSVLPPARHTNFVALKGAQVVATLEGEHVHYSAGLDSADRAEVESSLRRSVIHRKSFTLATWQD